MPQPTVIVRATDADLMHRVQANDTEAFEELYDRHAARAFRVARSVCRTTSAAEDAVQEGFLSIWRSRAHYRAARGSFAGWSMGIVRNRAIDAMRREPVLYRPHPAELDDNIPVTGEASVEDKVLERSQAETLRSALTQLPDVQAEVITLAFFGELTHTEIAAQLELPTGTVKGRMRLGLDKLRKQMRESASGAKDGATDPR